MRRDCYRVLICSALCLFLVSEACHAGFWSKPKKVTLLLVPARPRLIQLAFDMTRMRSVKVVSFRGDAESAEPVLYLWTGSEWRYVSVADFSENRFLKKLLSRVIIIGDDKMVPSVLIQCVNWCSNVEWIETLDIAELLNAFDRTFTFKNREWKWLARRYGLTLIDTNAERRSFNPYKIKRSELPLETLDFEQDSDDIPPAILIEKEVIEESSDGSERQPEELPQTKEAE